MSPDRSSKASILTAVLLLAGLLVATPARPWEKTFGNKTFSIESESQKAAKALAVRVGDVQKEFEKSRDALQTVTGPDGKVAYLQKDVTDLITQTEKELNRAIEEMQEPGFEALTAWVSYKLGAIQREAEVPASPTARLPGLKDYRLASSKGKTPPRQPAPPPTITAAKTDELLDRVGEVVARIFILAATDDLEVKLWVGSTPARKAVFGFWSAGSVRGSTRAPILIQIQGGRGKRDHLLRGLYHYKASWVQGALTELIEYPSTAEIPSEPLDLVDRSPFFCCRFGEKYCQHVDEPGECR
jgi:hypothetical protein